MALPFVDRPATDDERLLMQLSFSLFTNGFGSETDPNGSTRIGWRQIERVFANLFNGRGGEDKAVFDIIVPDVSTADVGLSVKSKTLSAAEFNRLPVGGRVYMELTNSPAVIWSSLAELGLSVTNFTAGEQAAEIGEGLIATVERWHVAAAALHARVSRTRTLNLERSIYLCVSMCKPTALRPRRFRVDSFSLNLPHPVRWAYHTPLCLRGYDPAAPDEALYDWYATSGGQLKFYPRTTTALFECPEFDSLAAPIVAMSDLVGQYWPELFNERLRQAALFR